ncbi:carboxylesterase/lipase family protein [Rhodococcoides fascians]|uniref:carboxylesterase/lipase family protein n=1 Tax=Rhodococcoides fascians TaxID=1828 RepID=UPI00056496D8|nr:carboxylesterase family protein [Rhodococcus fascians]
MKKTLAAVACVLLVGGCATATDNQPEPRDPLSVDTTTGLLRGSEVGGTRQFLGVRYAQPPVGDLRWALPEAAPDTEDTVDATSFGARCPQGTGPDVQTDEDCLFLNVTVPSDAGDGRLPVVVWWHGGGFTSGAGSDYDATRFAEQGNVIVVTVNYRLGMLGYLGLPGLEGSGNFGLADQLLALKWANDNAEAFGGDPDNVTVMGESAGGMSACAALGSPAAEGLVDKAIIQSGSCLIDWPAGTLYPGLPELTPYAPLAESEATGSAIADALGCTDDRLRCLRELPVEKVVEQSSSFGNGPAYGTDLQPTNPADAVRDGRTMPIPVIMGGNADEHRSFVGGALLADPTSVTDETYRSLIQQAFGTRAGEVEQRYPRTEFDSAALAWSTLVTDAAWSCPMLNTSALLSTNADVWSYEFADETAPDVSGVSATGLAQGAAHATDLPYTFDLNGSDLLTGPGQKDLSEKMIEAWSEFARSGDPGEGWPKTTDASGPVLEFGNPDTVVGNYYDAHQCGFWSDRG